MKKNVSIELRFMFSLNCSPGTSVKWFLFANETNDFNYSHNR